MEIRMMDRRADVVLAVSRGAWRIEVAKSVGMVNLPLSKEAIQYVKEKYEPVIYYNELSPRLLGDVGMDPKAKVGVIGAMSNICCRADLSDEVVYLVVKSYYDHFDEAKTYGKVCETATLELAVSDFNIPIHPGAIKYYREKGVWTDKHEERQQALLAKPKGKK